MRWTTIVASLALACTCLSPTAGAAAANPARTTANSSSSKTHSKSAHKHKHVSKRQIGQKAPASDRISEIQSALARGGYYQGDPSGKFDSDTVAALQKFQSANGLDASGKLDAPTLQKLGLGSDIAGVGAPRPVVRSCCSANPSVPAPPSNAPAANCCSMSAATNSASSAAASSSGSGASSSGATTAGSSTSNSPQK